MNRLYPPVDTIIIVTDPVPTQTTFTLTEVATHSAEKDCYLAIKDKVYDVSDYIGSHPGGRKNITSRCGEEVTGVFASIHSNFAWDLLGKYYIGTLISQ